MSTCPRLTCKAFGGDPVPTLKWKVGKDSIEYAQTIQGFIRIFFFQITVNYVGVISTDPPFMEWRVRITPVSLKAFS